MKNSTLKDGKHWLHREILICLLLAGAALAVYLQVTGFDFINFDDTIYVTENKIIHGGFNRESLCWAFQFTEKGNHSYWHPITWLSHIADCHFFGLNPAGHHLMNLLFHLANILLLYACLRIATGQVYRSALVAALFALHPLNVDGVAWIAERKNVLSTFFWFTTILFYIIYVRAPKWPRYILILGSFGLGLLAKPMLVTLPCALLLLDLWPLGRVRFEWDRDQTAALPGWERFSQFLRGNMQLLVEKIPLFVLSAVGVALSIVSNHKLGIVAMKEMIPLDLRLENAVIAYVKYLWKMIWPFDLAIYYPYPLQYPPIWQTLGALLLLCAVTAAAWLQLRKHPWLFTGWFWFLGILVPVSGIIQTGLWPELADRWAYVPEIGIFVIVVWGGAAVLEKKYPGKNANEKAFVYAGLPFLVFLAALTYIQLQTWRNSETVFGHALKMTRPNFVAHNNYGNARLSAGDVDAAIDHYRQALEINGKYSGAMYNLASIYARRNEPEKAKQFLYKIIQIEPTHAKAQFKYGELLAREKYWDAAVIHYQNAIREDPTIVEAYTALGEAMTWLKRNDEAAGFLRQALALQPDSCWIHVFMGDIQVRQQDYEKASHEYRASLDCLLSGKNEEEIDPGIVREKIKNLEALLEIAKSADQTGQPEWMFKKGNALVKVGDMESAEKAYQGALVMDPVYLPALKAWMLIRAEKGDLDQAVRLARKAIELEPSNPVGYYNLACFYARQNELEASAAALRQAIEAGYRNWDGIRTDKDLEAVRGIDAYRQLSADMEKNKIQIAPVAKAGS